MYILLIVLFLLLYAYLHVRRRVPILMYHRIATIPGDRNALPLEKFKDQMAYLKQKDFHTITMDTLENYYLHHTPLPKKPIVITFDDAYTDTYTTALPVLKEYGHVGNVFSIGNWQGTDNTWEHFGKERTTTMTPDELLLWEKEGNYAGPHTMDHPFLTTCDDQRLMEELEGSRLAMESLTGSPKTCICYPYGDLDRRVTESAKRAGYHLGLGIFYNLPLWTEDRLALPRVPIPARQPMWEYKLKVSSIHLLFIALRQWERKIKKILRK